MKELEIPEDCKVCGPEKSEVFLIFIGELFAMLFGLVIRTNPVLTSDLSVRNSLSESTVLIAEPHLS